MIKYKVQNPGGPWIIDHEAMTKDRTSAEVIQDAIKVWDGIETDPIYRDNNAARAAKAQVHVGGHENSDRFAWVPIAFIGFVALCSFLGELGKTIEARSIAPRPLTMAPVTQGPAVTPGPAWTITGDANLITATSIGDSITCNQKNGCVIDTGTGHAFHMRDGETEKLNMIQKSIEAPNK